MLAAPGNVLDSVAQNPVNTQRPLLPANQNQQSGYNTGQNGTQNYGNLTQLNSVPVPNQNSSQNFKTGSAGSPGPQQQPQFTAQNIGPPKTGSNSGPSLDQTFQPTTRNRFGHEDQSTTPATSQHDLIQGLVKGVLSELFSALRAQRNDSWAYEALGQKVNSMEANVEV